MAYNHLKNMKFDEYEDDRTDDIYLGTQWLQNDRVRFEPYVSYDIMTCAVPYQWYRTFIIKSNSKHQWLRIVWKDKDELRRKLKENDMHRIYKVKDGSFETDIVDLIYSAVEKRKHYVSDAEEERAKQLEFPSLNKALKNLL